MKQVEYKKLTSNHGYYLFLLGKANKCPNCNYSIDPIYKGVSANLNEVRNKLPDTLYVFLICTNDQCKAGFTLVYEKDRASAGNHINYSYSKPFAPSVFRESLPEAIGELSPDFISTYHQSSHAEQINLDRIAGMGYRRSLEYLIKDYLISKNPEESEEIRKKMLGQCINKYVDDPRIKKTAKRTAWLGNDHAHYEKRWVDKDLKDLKTLLRLTMLWIESEILTEQLEIDMPD